MRLCLDEAAEAARLGEVPVGAVLTQGERIVAKAHNGRERLSDPVAHAELLVLSMAGRQLETWRLTEACLYVSLEPCVMCAGALVNARLGRVVYAASDPKAGGVRSLYQICEDPRLNHRVEVESGLLEAEARSQLQAFFKARRVDLKARLKARKHG